MTARNRKLGAGVTRRIEKHATATRGVGRTRAMLQDWQESPPKLKRASRSAMTAKRVRRDKAALSSGCEPCST